MHSNDHIRKELESLDGTILLQCSKQMPYQVPAGYFQELEESKVFWMNEEAAVTENIPQSKSMPYALPENYFQNNIATVVTMASMEPTMDIAHKNTGAVPEGYFEQLPNQILNRIKNLDQAKGALEQKKTKVIDFKPADTRKRSWRLAAAVVAFLIGGWGVMQVVNPAEDTATIQTASSMGAGHFSDSNFTAIMDEMNTELLANQFNSDLPLEALISDKEDEVTDEDIIEYMTGEDFNM